MSFRRDKETALKWKQWVNDHRQELLDCGLPEEIIEDRHSWFYFLGHGYFTPIGSAKPVIDVDTMGASAACRLFRFLKSDPLYADSAAFTRLRHLVEKGL